MAVAVVSNRSGADPAEPQAKQDSAGQDHAVAANLPSR
jgi:hypothetical protein